MRVWALDFANRVGHTQAAVALANKLARYARTVVTHEVPFEARAKAA